MVYTGPSTMLPWVPDMSQIEWRQTLTFSQDGTSFTAVSNITVTSGTCSGTTISHGGDAVRQS